MSSNTPRDKIQLFFQNSQSLASPYSRLQDTLPDLVIFGGMVRDLFLFNITEFKSDIDLVTSASSREIFECIKNFNPVRNKFGGYRLFHLGLPFDIWSLQDTWAIREGHVKGKTIEDLCKTTFFNCDAIIYDVFIERIHTCPGYRKSMLKKLLDINLKPNPSPQKMANKAIQMCMEKEFSLTIQLCQFVLEHAYKDAHSLNILTAIEKHLETSNIPFGYNKQIIIDL